MLSDGSEKAKAQNGSRLQVRSPVMHGNPRTGKSVEKGSQFVLTKDRHAKSTGGKGRGPDLHGTRNVGGRKNKKGVRGGGKLSEKEEANVRCWEGWGRDYSLQPGVKRGDNMQ